MLRTNLRTEKIFTITSSASGSMIAELQNKDIHSLVAKFLVNTLTAAEVPELDVYVQTTDDGGTTYYDLGHFAQVTATGTSSGPFWQVYPVDGGEGKYIGSASDATISSGSISGLPLLGSKLKLRWVIGGDTMGDDDSLHATVTLYSHSEEPR